MNADDAQAQSELEQQYKELNKTKGDKYVSKSNKTAIKAEVMREWAKRFRENLW